MSLQLDLQGLDFCGKSGITDRPKLFGNVKRNEILENTYLMLPVASIPADKKPYGYIVWVVTLYWIVSIAMVYMNKILLSSNVASIPAPLFVTWYYSHLQ